MRNPWALAAGLILLAAAVLTAAHWPLLPYFLDSYYHLAVIGGFRDAGGLALHAFWEAAPEGRPHLYPPLFHLIFLHGALLKIDPITLARFWTWLCPPLLLAAAWLACSRVFGARLACLALISLTLPYSFFLATLNYPPASFVLVIAFGILLALHRRRPLAGGLLLAAAFWLHAGLPWLLALSLLLYGLVERTHRGTCWRILLIGLLGASPWLAHLYRHLPMIQFQPRGEDRFLDLPVAMILLGILGLLPAWRQGGLARLPVCMAAGFLPMLLAGYRFRFFAAQGAFPFLLLAAFALDRIVRRIRRPWIFVPLLFLLALAAPSVHVRPQPVEGRTLTIAWGDTALSTLSGLREPYPRGTGTSLYQERLMGQLEEAVRSHVHPDELVYCNVSYLGGMLTALTGRATTNQMLREMPERPLDQQIPPARLVVWIKDPSGQHPRALQEAALQFHLRPLAETELAYLYFNPRAEGVRKAVRRVVPWKVSSAVILICGLLAGWDLFRRRPAP